MGGGLSGTLAAAELLIRARTPLHVTLVERSGTIGAGVAYGTSCPDHFLNVRAAGMSAVAGDPDHLLAWLRGPGREAARRWGTTIDPQAFLPRGLYAEYARARLLAAAEGAAAGVSLDVAVLEARAVERGSEALRVLLSDGQALSAEHVVLALGNPAPRHPADHPSPFHPDSRYIPDPWSEEALRGLSADAAVLIVGTSLTMIDLVVALVRRGHRGTIHAVSRHGLLPREHALPASGLPAPPPGPTPRVVRGLLRALRQASKREAGGWRAAIDALRPRTQEIWVALPPGERGRFLRHARPYWETHRHRGVPANLRDLERLLASGRLRIHAGHVVRFEEKTTSASAEIRLRGSERVLQLEVERILNATGPEGDYRRAGMAIVDRLFRDGMARPGSLGLGLDATAEGALLDSSGRPSEILSTLGPPLRGVLWETTAVPEIRVQAARLAERLLGPR
ncbi:MAG TPA: FAD/NAD(P)-binding protein [Candidatus Limnocylindrales bacterium]|nr:FAD/NAD(P)-binding protein [Candidatus Limnocylindrales bacterium]